MFFNIFHDRRDQFRHRLCSSRDANLTLDTLTLAIKLLRMARLARSVVPRQPHHLTQRGNTGGNSRHSGVKYDVPRTPFGITGTATVSTSGSVCFKCNSDGCVLSKFEWDKSLHVDLRVKGCLTTLGCINFGRSFDW